MSYVTAGAASGLLMASVFIAIAPIMLFVLAKEPTPAYRATLGRIPPMALMISIVVFAYPTWALLGVATGLLYRAVDTAAPGDGIGGHNLAYSIAVVLATIALAAPVALLLRRVLLGVIALAVVFAGIFGWALPFLAR